MLICGSVHLDLYFLLDPTLFVALADRCACSVEAEDSKPTNYVHTYIRTYVCKQLLVVNSFNNIMYISECDVIFNFMAESVFRSSISVYCKS